MALLCGVCTGTECGGRRPSRLSQRLRDVTEQTQAHSAICSVFTACTDQGHVLTNPWCFDLSKEKKRRKEERKLQQQ